MGIGYAFEGKSGQNYTFLLTDISNKEALTVHGGVLVITESGQKKPAYVGAVEHFKGSLDNLHVHSKALPAGGDYYLMTIDDPNERHRIQKDLIENYDPLFNKNK